MKVQKHSGRELKTQKLSLTIFTRTVISLAFLNTINKSS